MTRKRFRKLYRAYTAKMYEIHGGRSEEFDYNKCMRGVGRLVISQKWAQQGWSYKELWNNVLQDEAKKFGIGVKKK